MDGKATILIIDDEEALRFAARMALEENGFHVLEAGDGEEGLRVSLNARPDLVLCDIEMPKKDGYEVLKMFRADPSTATVPFVFFTGRSGKGDMRKGMDLGADDFLTKPFTADELISTVQSRLSRVARVRDDTQRKLDELRVNISTSVPHELRTPLSGILGFGTILAEQAGSLGPEELKDIAEHILGSARRLQNTLEKFWRYSELVFLSHGSRRPPVANLTSSHLLIRSMARQKAQSLQRDSDLVLALDEEMTIAVDEKHFVIILEELLENAFKFSTAGSKVRVEYGRTGDRTARFLVRDEGRGMSREEIEGIGGFMQFGRKRHEQQGLGLGLSMVQEIAHLYGGTVRVFSEPGKGTAVEVILPLS
ncbi:MAG: hybrid sensor histidine kinase/response regulator [Bacteroidia bacterium]|nr:MAG: hybrid sensor histidine kinase/response regulator [Bacteroidia bacterium]